MTKLKSSFPILLTLLAFVLTACAGATKPIPQFQAQPVDTGRYDKRADHLIFIMDASSSMAESYQDYRKLDIATSVVRNFNDTMPDMDLGVAMYSFGHDQTVSHKLADVVLPYQRYSRSALASAVGKVSVPGGTSPMASALAPAGDHLKKAKGRVAVVVVSDGKDMGAAPLAAARSLKASLANRLCIYTVLVGDAADGTSFMKNLSDTTDCGASVTADSLQNPSAMNQFVRQVLFSEKKEKDSDGDGVLDSKDQCPQTPAGTKVDATGCPVPMATKSAQVTEAGTWIYKGIQFENNRADLRPSSFSILNEIVEGLKAQKDLKIEIQGHTDSSGTRSYNMGLSQRRAAAVKAYLESKSIDASRLTTRGFGPDRPIASNATKEGRAKNRRVEIKPIQ